MNFTRFPSNAVNVFPIANSKSGGQLVTEFNLRSRETILTDPAITYSVGPSYCHSMDDFRVTLEEDELGVIASSTVLSLKPGRAVVNGHYFESLTNVVVDLAEANKELNKDKKPLLKGRLAVGLRAMYSTEQTLSASLRIENSQHMLEGIQIVILPVGNIEQGYFVTPSDSPTNPLLVTAHLKLAEFYYMNGVIRSIVQNESKIKCISADRVGDFKDLLTDHYVKKDGLNPKKIYTMAGKSKDGKKISGKSTWCDSTDSLFIWEKASDLTVVNEDPGLKQAEFYVNDDERITLAIPHKHVDGSMWNADGKEEFYKPRYMTLPAADFLSNTPGTITSEYTKQIKSIREKFQELYHLPLGKQRGFIDELSEDRKELPEINYSSWLIGDYILVRKDNSVVSSSTNLIQAPSTIYTIKPPRVSKVEFLEMVEEYEGKNGSIPLGLDGCELFKANYPYPGTLKDTKDEIELELNEWVSDQNRYNELLAVETNTYYGTYRISASSTVLAEGTNDSGNDISIVLEGDKYTPQDYLTVVVNDVPKDIEYDENGVTKTKRIKSVRKYYYRVSETKGSNTYSDPILLTGTIPLATTDTIGGFINVKDTDLDSGYVIRDEKGHLKILDYALLRSGVLAYTLNKDYDFGSGLSTTEIQTQLNEYVNDRVAMPKKDGSDIINLHLNLSKEEGYETLVVKDIDSRWNTILHITLTGSPTSTTTINIVNCQNVKLSLNFTSTNDTVANPTINIYNSTLCYDASVIDYILSCDRKLEGSIQTVPGQTLYPKSFTGFENVSLWYRKLDKTDPELLVNGNVVTQIKTPIVPEDIDFWNEQVVNDNHYYYGLQSITLDNTMTMVGCGIYLRNDLSANIEFGKNVAIANFKLPQGTTLAYPKSSLKHQLKITGSFVTAYSQDDPKGYIVMTTHFTALTQSIESEHPKGTISFLSQAEMINDFISIDGLDNGAPIDGWESNSYHVFKGWSLGC